MVRAADTNATPAPATSPRPVLARLDCQRRTRCLGVVASATPPGRTDEYSPYLDCRSCRAYAPESDPEQQRSDVATLCAVGLAAMRGWRRVANARGGTP